MERREFLNILAIAAAAGAALDSKALLAATPSAVDKFYDLPRFGNVHLLHMTDCHAQLKPIYFREPRVNLGFGSALNQPPWCWWLPSQLPPCRLQALKHHQR